MRAEIGEQPEALRRTLDSLVPRVPEIRSLAEGTRQVLFIARGSSDNAAVYGRYLAETHTGRLSTLAAPSVATEYKRRLDLTGVLAVAISQSGKTEEIVETLRWHDRHHQRRRVAAGRGGRGGIDHRGGRRARRARHEDLHHPARRGRPGRAGPGR
jgi:fructoselysine-6-P-deglycase FrlB-like protein